MLLVQTGVSIASFVSNTIDASASTTEPSGASARGRTVKFAHPSPSGATTFGGRNPAKGSVIGPPAASSVVQVQVTVRVSWSRAAWNRTQYPRSEEHTSELQSLMRISYAVFCLKKK